MNSPLENACLRLAEGDPGPLTRLWENGYRPSPDEFRRLAAVKIKQYPGKMADPNTAERDGKIADLILAYRSERIQLKPIRLKPRQAKLRALRKVLPLYPMPDGGLISDNIESDCDDLETLLGSSLHGKQPGVRKQLKIRKKAISA